MFPKMCLVPEKDQKFPRWPEAVGGGGQSELKIGFKVIYSTSGPFENFLI